MGAATWAHAAFALGYAEDGSFPPSPRTQAACLAAQESVATGDDPRVGPLIVEAGRVEGKRSAREKAHAKLYGFHADALTTILARILARVDVGAVAAHVVATAKEQADAGYDPVTRRKAVQAVALGSIAAQIGDQDRAELDALNATGYSHATAYGTAEAQATPAKGGPPDPAKIAAAAAAALTLVNPADAAEAISTWTPIEIQSIAMGAALAAGDGSAVGESARKVAASLVDTGRATATYANQLHQAVNAAYVAQTQADNPGVLYDWVTAADPCDDCTDNQLNSPYLFLDLPGCPEHFRCQCNVEVSTSSPALVNA